MIFLVRIYLIIASLHTKFGNFKNLKRYQGGGGDAHGGFWEECTQQEIFWSKIAD